MSTEMLKDLSFFAWLARIMDELPDKYLEPELAQTPLSLDSKPVGQLTEAEKRLFGAFRQLEEAALREKDAHEALHDNPNHSIEDCLRLNESVYYQHMRLATVYNILLSSVGERLSLPESEFVFNGNDIYAVVPELIEQMRFESEFTWGSTVDQNDNIDIDPNDPNKMN